jgi:RNA recognition motif-containing protein
MDTLFEIPFSGLIAQNGFHCPKMGKISNITNSSDPQAINSRIFVGNVNTFALTKDDIEAVFKRYGKIIGISMHKGYAFIQYTSDTESRNAVAGEDQRMYAGQQIGMYFYIIYILHSI